MGSPAGGDDQGTGARPEANGSRQTGFLQRFVQSLFRGSVALAIAGVLAGLVRLALGAPDLGAIGLTGMVFLACQVIVSASEAALVSPEQTLLRASLVAFCRTLLPLVALAIAEYNGRLQFGREWAVVVAIFYFVPLVLGVKWTVRELNARP